MTAINAPTGHTRSTPVGSPWQARTSTRWADAWEDLPHNHDLDDHVIDLYTYRPQARCVVVPSPTTTTIATERVLAMLVEPATPQRRAVDEVTAPLRPMTVNQAWVTLFAVAIPWAVVTGVSFNKPDFIITPGVGIFGLLALGVIGATIITWTKTNPQH